MRNRASGFCYVADIVLGIMLLTKEGVPRSPRLLGVHGDALPKKKSRRPRVMYLDLDLHYGDGVAQAFHSPSFFPTTYSAPHKPPKPPQVLTLSVHHLSPIFFPPPTPLARLPSPDSPHPFTLSIPLAAYASPVVYARIMRKCIEPIKNAFDPDYIVLQLGVDGLPGDKVGQWGGWSTEGEGGISWCVEKVKSWGLGLCVLGGGGYRHMDTARAWSLATGILVSYAPRTAAQKLIEPDWKGSEGRYANTGS
jgi:histone deacetylase 1/2